MPAHDHDPHHWSNQPATIVAAGVAAVLLIGVLVFAVMRTAEDSSEPPGTLVTPSSSATSSTYTTSSTTTTTYTTPSPQTSDQDLPPSSPSPTGDGPATPTTEDTPDLGTVTETASLLPPPP